VIVETDHKPLESLIKKALCKAPQEVTENRMLKVQQYDVKVKYMQGRNYHLLIRRVSARIALPKPMMSCSECLFLATIFPKNAVGGRLKNVSRH
jgi:hypothetical protein